MIAFKMARFIALELLRSSRWIMARFDRVVPCTLFIALLGAFAGLAAAAGTRSLVLTLLAAIGLLGVIAAFGGWLLSSDRRASQPPRHVPWREDEWRRFEAAFWDYVDRRRGVPPQHG